MCGGAFNIISLYYKITYTSGKMFFVVFGMEPMTPQYFAFLTIARNCIKTQTFLLWLVVILVCFQMTFQIK